MPELVNFKSAASILEGEIIPRDAIIMNGVGLPEGFIPDERQPLPPGFILQAVLTTEDLPDDKKLRTFTQEGSRLRKKYGREAVCTSTNGQRGWEQNPTGIALAHFVHYNATPLPRIMRARRALSRALFGVVCDVNF